MNYADAVEWLYGTQLHGIKLGLENTSRLVAALGIEVARLRYLHVAGTNGKGSVCALLESVCRAAGLKTGLFTSPHLITFRERIRVAGELIGEEEVVARLSAIRELVADWDHSPTFFEITTALALAHFQENEAEIVVLETGMGGRLDATNIVTPLVTVLTAIDLDHQQWLGATLAQIAAEKAGIIKPRVPVVSAPQQEMAELVIRHLAFERGAPLQFVREPLVELEVGMAGSHQRWNAALAVEALAQAGLGVTPEATSRGLVNVDWPGRFQQFPNGVILDGAHNPAASQRLVQTWREMFGEARATLVLGVLEDKDQRGICEALLPIAARVICVPVQSPRSAAAIKLQGIVESADPQMPTFLEQHLPAALQHARQFPERVLVTGSLFLVGEALALLQEKTYAEISAQ